MSAPQGQDEYVPTTDDVREACYQRFEGFDGDDAFDRWLAAHDAEVREAAAREARAHVFVGTKDIVALCSCGAAGVVNALNEAPGWHARHVLSIVRGGAR